MGKYTNVRGSEREGRIVVFARIYNRYVDSIPRKLRDAAFVLCFVRIHCFFLRGNRNNLRRNRNYVRQKLKKLRRNFENVGVFFLKSPKLALQDSNAPQFLFEIG